MPSRTNKKTQTITLQIPEELVNSADLYGKLLGLNQSAALLQWLRAGGERAMLQLVNKGELSTGKFVEVMDVTYHDVHPLREKYRLELSRPEESDEESGLFRDERAGKITEILKSSLKTPQE